MQGLLLGGPKWKAFEPASSTVDSVRHDFICWRNNLKMTQAGRRQSLV
jgi:hypothetical protein